MKVIPAMEIWKARNSSEGPSGTMNRLFLFNIKLKMTQSDIFIHSVSHVNNIIVFT